MDFEYYFHPPAVVQEKKKYSNFTVREVTKEELDSFRKKRAEEENVYNLRLNSRDKRLSDFETETGQGLDTPGLIHGKGAGNSKMSWQDKLELALAERRRLANSEVTTPFTWETVSPPKKTFRKRITNLIKWIWESANP